MTSQAMTPAPSRVLPPQSETSRAPSSGASRPAARAHRAQRTAELLQRAARADEPERQTLLEEVVVLNMGVARSVVSRYRLRGIGTDDLEQVAYLALVKAAHGFDADSGHEFVSYAVPTIRGEVKRHFRDHGWMVRPPRRIQELQGRIASVDSELAFELGRSPRPSEIAARLEEPLDDVLEALSTDGCFTPYSLDHPVGEDGDASLGDLIGDEQSTGAVEARILLGPAVRALSERDRRILKLRFFRGWTQSEIAQDIGVTQMQVSRLLSRILRQLRQELVSQDVVGADRTAD